MIYVLVAFLIGLAILVHEFGHFLAARWVGIPIQRFSLGFGPKLLGWQRKGTEYRLSLIPIGGYVLPALDGEADYFRVPVWKRVVLAAGGPVASLVLPVLCYQAMGLLSGAGSLQGLVLDPMVRFWDLLVKMLLMIPALFARPDQLSGVVGIVAQGSGFVAGGLVRGLEFLALMSANLAILNLLPIPALDGGKILLCGLEAVHPRLARLHLPMAVAGWVMILGLMVWVTVLDVGRLI